MDDALPSELGTRKRGALRVFFNFENTAKLLGAGRASAGYKR
jgi:hypothetical protein